MHKRTRLEQQKEKVKVRNVKEMQGMNNNTRRSSKGEKLQKDESNKEKKGERQRKGHREKREIDFRKE